MRSPAGFFRLDELECHIDDERPEQFHVSGATWNRDGAEPWLVEAERRGKALGLTTTRDSSYNHHDDCDLHCVRWTGWLDKSTLIGEPRDWIRLVRLHGWLVRVIEEDEARVRLAVAGGWVPRADFTTARQRDPDSWNSYAIAHGWVARAEVEELAG